MKRTSAADRIDALLWLAVPVLVLLALPVGFVSNDGLGQSRSFAEGSWHWNPNHLLLEPLGAWWQARWPGSAAREPVDALKALSALAGALAAALFRRGVAPRLAETRRQANHATAWLAGSSAFLRLWVSDEVHMIQMPFVVAVAWAALRYRERPSLGRAAAVGAAAGLAALAFLSNAGLALTLGLALSGWHLARREGRAAARAVAGVVCGAGLAAGPPLLAAWLASPGAPGFLAWLTRYGGGVQATRVEQAYGLAGSLGGLGESALRALYGAASALVDLTPLAAAVRDRQALSPVAVAGALAFLAAAAVMLAGLTRAWRERQQPEGGGALLLVFAFAAAVLGFGLFWNNSDDQFYFQLAPAFGALAAQATRGASRTRRVPVAALLLGASLAALTWNLADVAARRVLYPREERMALLDREVRGACLAVVPGFDEAELLLALSRPSRNVERLALTDLAVRHPAAEGLPLLAGRVRRCLAAGGRVVLVDLYDTPPERNPWKFLRRLGYDRPAVERALAPFPFDAASRRAGPFRVRTAARRS